MIVLSEVSFILNEEYDIRFYMWSLREKLKIRNICKLEGRWEGRERRVWGICGESFWYIRIKIVVVKFIFLDSKDILVKVII